MIVVHHLENSRSQRILWLLEELGLAYELRRYERDPKTMLAPTTLRSIHPLGKSPILEDEGRVIAETGAIVEYLVEKAGGAGLVPEGEDERLAYRYFLHYAEGSAATPLLVKLIFDKVAEAGGLAKPLLKAVTAGVVKQFVRPQLDLHMRFWEGRLAKTGWFAGEDFSAADVVMSFPLEMAEAVAGLDARWPNCRAFLKRIRMRAAYERALEAGGPYSLGDPD